MRRMFIGLAAMVAAMVGWGIVPGAQAQTFKVGYVFMDEIRQKGQPYQEALGRLQQLSQQRQGEAQERQSEIQRLQERLQRQGSLMSEARRAELEQEIRQKLGQYEQWAGQAAQDLQKQQLEVIQPIDERVLQLIQRIAAERNYDLVLDGSAIAYLKNQESHNLTAAVIAALNQQ